MDGQRSTAEIITTAISVLLIVALAGAILYEGYASGHDDPARLNATVLSDETIERDGRYYVPIEIVNEGDQTVEEVLVAIEARAGEELVVETETTIATLGEAEQAGATLILDEDPAGLTIEARVVTFQVAEQ